MRQRTKRIWAYPAAIFEARKKPDWTGFILLFGLIGIIIGLISLSREWTGPLRPAVNIDLSISALPKYAFFSLSRGLIAYVFSFFFTLAYGYWAAKDKVAERLLLPLLDILQSIPVLGFMPGLIIALVSLFPHSNIGLELAAILMIFTGQVWNMTFSFYHSLRSVPEDLKEVGLLYRFDWWRRFKWIELPFSTMPLVWNSMMSMAGGWFFLMINEAFVLGNRDFRLPGIGSYMSVAVARGDSKAMLLAVLAMMSMIVLLDQFLWRPLVVWAQKFRVEETGHEEKMTSWFLDWLRSTRLWRMQNILQRLGRKRDQGPIPNRADPAGKSSIWFSTISKALFVLLSAGLILGLVRLIHILVPLKLSDWKWMIHLSLLTLGRVLLATVLGTIWTVPAGLAIGLSPRLSRIFQPIVQVVASFPAPMLFPLVIAGLKIWGVGLGWGSILLMLVGTQWYILFNVIAGAMFVPSDLKEAAQIYRISGTRRFWALYLPIIFPYLVTGWITAAGGAWNASIVAELVFYKGQTLAAPGIGAQISRAAEAANFPLLAGSIVVMSSIVVLFNRTVWKRCYALAERRYSLTK